MTKLYYNGLGGLPAVEGWERATIIYPHQLELHPTTAPEGTGQTRLIVTDEEKYLDTLSLNKVVACGGGIGLQRQIAMLVPVREKYPNAQITMYGLPYCSYGWKCVSGKIEVAYHVWSGAAGEPKDRDNMQKAAKLIGDLLCGATPNSAALKDVRVDGLSPSLYATDLNDGKCLEGSMMELALAQFIDEYVFAKHDRTFTIIPFIRSRRPLGTMPFLSDSSFDVTQIAPIRRANPDGVYYWSDDGVRIASAKDPNHSAHERSMETIRQDVPEELLFEPIDWNAVREWYNDRHVGYMNRVVEGLRQP